jgi:hypothetical protein
MTLLRDRLGIALFMVLSSGCTQSADTQEGQPTDGEASEPTFTYWRDAKSVLDRKCAGCHVEGDMAPFALTTYAEVAAVAPILSFSIAAGTMPPWPPADGCQAYQHDRSLADEERDLLLTWLSEGAPEGDPTDAAPSSAADSTATFQPDVTLTMLEPYTPSKSPDDYRCFVIPWNGNQPWVTGFRVVPDQRSIVHHVIAFATEPGDAATVEAMDAADEGPGYTCFGDSGVFGARWIGSWAPGGRGTTFPADTGVRLEPGSRVILQVHYNTAATGAIADQSAIELSLADEVERPLVNQPVLNPGWVIGYDPMTIPAGAPNVTHDAEIDLRSPLWAIQIAETGVKADEDLLLHGLALHMHQLGVRAKLTVIRDSADSECVLDIPEWDFSWQEGYMLSEPIRLHPGDKIGVQCWWDNSAENQPIIDGEQVQPIDVEWGEGTRDEMCLGILALSRP